MAYLYSRGNLEVGFKIGQWTLLDSYKVQRLPIACRCDCGSTKMVLPTNLLKGTSTRCKSCALVARPPKYRQKIYSAHIERLYSIWSGMKDRCRNPEGHAAKHYHERGIRVCQEWAGNYEAFKDWALANGYRDNLTLDRWPDQNGNYEPSNCRWATMKQQQRNKTNNRLITAFGETKALMEWAEDSRCIVGRGGLWSRLDNGWGPEDAITTPMDVAEEMRAAQTRGDQNGNSILDEQAVRAIRQQCIEGRKPQWQIAQEFGIAQCTVSAIHRRKLWEWLP